MLLNNVCVLTKDFLQVSHLKLRKYTILLTIVHLTLTPLLVEHWWMTLKVWSWSPGLIGAAIDYRFFIYHTHYATCVHAQTPLPPTRHFWSGLDVVLKSHLCGIPFISDRCSLHSSFELSFFWLCSAHTDGGDIFIVRP